MSSRPAPSSSPRGSSPGSSSETLPRVKRTTRRALTSSTSVNETGDVLSGSVSTKLVSTPKSRSPLRISAANSSSDRRPK